VDLPAMTFVSFYVRQPSFYQILYALNGIKTLLLAKIDCSLGLQFSSSTMQSMRTNLLDRFLMFSPLENKSLLALLDIVSWYLHDSSNLLNSRICSFAFTEAPQSIFSEQERRLVDCTKHTAINLLSLIFKHDLMIVPLRNIDRLLTIIFDAMKFNVQSANLQQLSSLYDLLELLFGQPIYPDGKCIFF